MRIDMHCHIVPAFWRDWASQNSNEPWPKLVRRGCCKATILTGDRFFRDVTDQCWDPSRRIRDMDQLGIDIQVLSPPPVMFCYWAEPAAAATFARMQNENIAEIVERWPNRFRGMSTVPLQHTGLAIEELSYARERLNLDAVEIGTCPGGRDFDDPELFPFFEACHDLGVAIFVHPASPVIGVQRMRKYYFPLNVGNPLETALCVSSLIFGGVLGKIPKLRICFAHGGGAFPYTLPRLDHGWRVRPEGPAAIPRKPSHYAKSLFFDSLTLDATNLRFLIARFGADRVMMGSDYSFDMGASDPVASIAEAYLSAEAPRSRVKPRRAFSE